MERYNKIVVAIIGVMITSLLFFEGFLHFRKTGEVDTNYVEEAVNVLEEVKTYTMSEDDIRELPSNEIKEKTEEDENALEQEVESEGFEIQGQIAYEGDRARSWNVTLGDYRGLVYYSQLDSRWANKMYSSIGNRSQTIGTSGCGPTSASMVVTACKGSITPDTMSDLFVQHGFRSANQGTYWSAFRAVADEFNIGYEETRDIQRALQLLQSNRYVIASCGNGLFTNGGHFIVLTGVENGHIKIYDPYLYSGKFETSTRRGKVSVSGNTVYCPINNFVAYANAQGFFCFAHDGSTPVNNTPVVTSTYTRYVKANGGLNVRNAPNGARIGGLASGTNVTVESTSGNWSHIISPVNGWVCSDYLSSYSQVTNTPVSKSTGYRTGNYRVTASVLNVRTGPSTGYRIKKYYELTANARSQNKRLGNYYTNGLKRGVITTVTKVIGEWGLTPSGYVCLRYCTKL